MKRKQDAIPLALILQGFLAVMALLAQPARSQTAPSIFRQPVSQTNLAGANAIFSVGVTGSGPIHYQWWFNGTPLPNDLISTVAGLGPPQYSGDGGPAADAGLNDPVVAVVDASGSLFIAEMDNNRIRKVDTNGIITTVAGNGAVGYSGDGGPAINAELFNPSGVAADGAGNLFIADQINNRIRKVDVRGIISTVAGNGVGADTGKGSYSGDGGAATNAGLWHPEGVALDGSGNLFVADSGNSVIRRVDKNGIITTVAGNGSPGYSGDGGAATQASLSGPSSVAVDGSGQLFIADPAGGAIRRVDAKGIITTVAGNGSQGFSGDGGPATNASLHAPFGVAIDADGDIFIADDLNQRVREVDTKGIITTVAGNGSYGFFGDGGPAANATLSYPQGVGVDASGNIFIADSGNNRVRAVALLGFPILTLDDLTAANIGDYQVIITSPYGSVTSAVATLTVLGAPSIVSQPASLAVDAGNTASFSVGAAGAEPLSFTWYFEGFERAGGATAGSTLSFAANITDRGFYNVVVANAFGSVTSLTAALYVGYPPSIKSEPAGQTNYAGTNAALNATVSGTAPFQFQWRQNGTNLPDNIISTVAGNGFGNGTLAGQQPQGAYSGDGGEARRAGLYLPSGVALDAAGNIFIADLYNQVIRKVGADGIISTVAGNGHGLGVGAGTGGYAGDGGPATSAKMDLPSGVAVDAAGALFIADSGNNVIRKVDTNGMISTFAGTGSTAGGAGGYCCDGGPATNAGLSNPSGVVLDSFGNLFIADEGNNRVRKVDAHGIITTVAGNGLGSAGGGSAGSYTGNGGPATNAGVSLPSGVAVDSLGNLFIADSGNNVIRKVDPYGIITTVAGNGAGAGTGSGGYSGDGGAATSASLSSPSGVATDGLGNLFIADAGNNRIRQVDIHGIISTVAGNGAASYLGDGGTANNASIDLAGAVAPIGLTLDGFGNLFIPDEGNNVIREVALPGSATLTLGDLSVSDIGDYQLVVTSPFGSATSVVASVEVLSPPVILAPPAGLFVTAGGTATLGVEAGGAPPLSYFWYFNGTKLVQSGTNSALVLTNAGLSEGGAYAVVVTNLFGGATSVVAALSVGLAPAITNQPVSQTAAGGGTATFSVTAAGTAPLSYQWLFDGAELPTDLIATRAGSGSYGYSGDGAAATNAALAGPSGMAADALGNLFIADVFNNRIRKAGFNGVITTVAGNGAQIYAGDGRPATNASLSSPQGIAVDGWGNLYIADTGNQVVRKVDTNGVISTVAGNGNAGYIGDGGAATNASLSLALPQGPAGIVGSGVAVDASGNLFIADSGNNVIREVGIKGIISTVAGAGAEGYSGDGAAATAAKLSAPQGVLADASGNLYIADTGNNVVRKVDANGVITTVAGNGAPLYAGDGGPATNASLSSPTGVALDAAGNMYIADEGNQRVRKTAFDGTMSTEAGDAAQGYSGDGGAAARSSLDAPAGVTVDASGNLFIADSGNNRIRKVPLLGFPTLTLRGVSAASGGAYQVVVSSPYGGVTSAVANLTIRSATNQNSGLVMSVPVISGNNLLLGFSSVQDLAASFTLLQARSVTGPWTTNTSAVFGTNTQGGGYQFSVPAPVSTEFYQVRAP